MKQVIVTFVAALFCVNTALASANEFEINESKLAQEFAELDAIDMMVETSSFTFEQLVKEEPTILASLSANPLAPNFSFDDMDWGAFAWGFCCWPIGFFVVAINSSKDSDQKASYWIGTATSFVLGTIGALTSPNTF